MGTAKCVYCIEDNPGDRFLLGSLFKAIWPACSIEFCTTGEEAVQTLTGVGAYKCLPDLIVLDLNLPVLNGHEVLRRLKAGPLAAVPVIILSSSADTADMQATKEEGALAYFVKPIDLDRFEATVNRLASTWAEHHGR